nr:Gag-Pol polyprotein [Tanacetum cinerariifolium]
MKEKNDDMYEKMTRFMEDMRRVPEANTTPIIADQHFGVSDISGFQSYQPGTSNWQNLMTSYSPNLPPPTPSHRQDAGIFDPNLCDRARREPQPSVYMLSPYTVLPPTTVLTKKKIDKTKKKGKTKKLSPLNLGNTFADENVSVDDVTITGVQQTDNYFKYETVDPDKHMDSWIQILIRETTENVNWTLAKSANLSEDIQCAGSDTRPPMLDRTNFASWQQRIRLYCRGKDNGVNILKSIDEGPYKLGTFRETLAESTEGTPQFDTRPPMLDRTNFASWQQRIRLYCRGKDNGLGLKRPRVYSDLKSEEKDRYNADIRATNILLQGFPKDIYTLINHYTDAKDIWDNVKMLLEGSGLTKEDRESQLYDDFEHFRQHKEESIHDYYV